MRAAWHRFLDPLTPGVRVLLSLLAMGYVLSIAGRVTGAYDLYAPLSLNGADFWKGKVWQIVTYALLPASLFDFLFNWMVILFLGVWLEKAWSRGQLLMCCLVSVVGAGIVWVGLEPSGQRSLVGTTPIVFGMLASWGFLVPNGRVLMYFIWEMSVRQAAILLTVLSALLMIPCCGAKNVLIMLCGGLASLCVFWTRAKMVGARHSREVVSERMGRLEL